MISSISFNGGRHPVALLYRDENHMLQRKSWGSVSGLRFCTGGYVEVEEGNKTLFTIDPDIHRHVQIIIQTKEPK